MVRLLTVWINYVLMLIVLIFLYRRVGWVGKRALVIKNKTVRHGLFYSYIGVILGVFIFSSGYLLVNVGG